MAKVIMVQGTMSSAGKSLLVAALCRIFSQDGYRVAPFKSQNMALNSFITREELEMGRAQVVQAEAAGIEPSVAMNPILLKPTSNMGSQLIVNGKVRGNYSAAEYFKMKQDLIPDILSAYRSLDAEYDIVVVEGAGSPAEINLKANDIVNMGLAELLDAPVLLVGDIDRGGVFAQLYGTVALLEESERQRIRALVINKFRGDRDILTPGLSMLYEKIPIPTAGVIPYLDVDIEDEDSLTERFTKRQKGAGELGKIAVIRLPRISNFTDFQSLERLHGVSLSYVSKLSELKNPDMIILPGTKNTMGDLKWLRQSGLEAAILKKADEGVPVVGICGGYQMLGESLQDPGGVEEGGSLNGLGLLPVETVFAADKTRTRVEGTACIAGRPSLEGYEIHMGETKRRGGEPFAILTDSTPRPEAKEDGCIFHAVFGTYVHGVFDTEDMQTWVLETLAERRGIALSALENSDIFSQKAYKEMQYDRLAAAVRDSLDMDLIYQILNREDRNELDG